MILHYFQLKFQFSKLLWILFNEPIHYSSFPLAQRYSPIILLSCPLIIWHRFNEILHYLNPLLCLLLLLRQHFLFIKFKGHQYSNYLHQNL